MSRNSISCAGFLKLCSLGHSNTDWPRPSMTGSAFTRSLPTMLTASLNPEVLLPLSATTPHFGSKHDRSWVLKSRDVSTTFHSSVSKKQRSIFFFLEFVYEGFCQPSTAGLTVLLAPLAGREGLTVYPQQKLPQSTSLTLLAINIVMPFIDRFAPLRCFCTFYNLCNNTSYLWPASLLNTVSAHNMGFVVRVTH